MTLNSLIIPLFEIIAHTKKTEPGIANDCLYRYAQQNSRVIWLEFVSLNDFTIAANSFKSLRSLGYLTCIVLGLE